VVLPLSSLLSCCFWASLSRPSPELFRFARNGALSNLSKTHHSMGCHRFRDFTHTKTNICDQISRISFFRLPGMRKQTPPGSRVLQPTTATAPITTTDNAIVPETIPPPSFPRSTPHAAFSAGSRSPSARPSCPTSPAPPLRPSSNLLYLLPPPSRGSCLCLLDLLCTPVLLAPTAVLYSSRAIPPSCVGRARGSCQRRETRQTGRRKKTEKARY
jgi:hypothetical protein